MFILLLLSILVLSNAAPSDHTGIGIGRSFKNALNQQNMQTILQSIEERLRNLDQIYAIRYPKPDFNSDQLIRKIELLEAKLNRIETQFETRLEKISENMSSKNFKDDLVKEQLFRKMDSFYERINHKFDYSEGKLDMDILKLQTKLEGINSKIDRLDHSFSVRQADMESEISEGVKMMENVKNNVNKLVNVTKYSIETSYNKQFHLIHNFTNSITQIDGNKTNLYENYKDIGNKVNYMYNELWDKSTSIENSIKSSIDLMNETRKEFQKNVDALLKNSEYKIGNQNDGQFETIVDSLTNTMQRKYSESNKKLESNIENIMLLQNLFLESCHRIQMDETQLESKISQVLEKLLDALTNKSVNAFEEFHSLEELIKLHDANVYRYLTQNTNITMKLLEKTSEDRKKLEKILSTLKKDIGNSLETIQNDITLEDDKNNEKISSITAKLLEVQEQVNDLDNRFTNESMNYSMKQILENIIRSTKELSSEDTYIQKMNQTILQILQPLSKVINDVHHLLTNKINSNSYNSSEFGDMTETVDIPVPISGLTKFLNRFNYTIFPNENKTMKNNKSYDFITKDTIKIEQENNISKKELNKSTANTNLKENKNNNDFILIELVNESLNNTKRESDESEIDIKNDFFSVDLELKKNPEYFSINESIKKLNTTDSFEETDYDFFD